MIEYKCIIEAEVNVSFSDEGKASDYFIDGDWKDCFFEAMDLEEFVQILSLGFFNTEDSFLDGELVRAVEGFVVFVYDDEENKYVSEYTEYGKIFISGDFEADSSVVC